MLESAVDLSLSRFPLNTPLISVPIRVGRAVKWRLRNLVLRVFFCMSCVHGDMWGHALRIVWIRVVLIGHVAYD